MYSITYRKQDGTTAQAVIYAYSEANARAAFLAQYDGRIVSVTFLQAWTQAER